MKLSKAQFKQIATLCDVPHFKKGCKPVNPQFGNSQSNGTKADKKSVNEKNRRRNKKAAAKSDVQQGRDRLFDKLCVAHGLPEPVHEYEFAETIGRQWAFDYLFDGWLAVEKQGGIWINGHHSGGQNQIDDMEKKNHAVLLGFCVLEFTPEQFNDGSAFAFIRRVLEAKEEQT